LKKLIKDNLINGFNSLTKKAMLSNEKFANTLVSGHCKKTVQPDNFVRTDSLKKKLRLADKNKSGGQQPLKKTGRH